jgi:hypothetical protein
VKGFLHFRILGKSALPGQEPQLLWPHLLQGDIPRSDSPSWLRPLEVIRGPRCRGGAGRCHSPGARLRLAPPRPREGETVGGAGCWGSAGRGDYIGPPDRPTPAALDGSSTSLPTNNAASASAGTWT